MTTREAPEAREQRLYQKALSFERPFSISDIGTGLDYAPAGKLLRRLHSEGHIRKVNFVDERKPYLIKYEWVND